MKQICEECLISPKTKPKDITREQVEKIIAGIKKVRIMAPSSECISPIEADLIEKGIRKEVNAEFYTSITRNPAVYRGNPFIIEAAIAYGGNIPEEKSVEIMRFANRVPLLYQQGSCASTKSIQKLNWKLYGLKQSKNQLPIGPMIILVHMASVWVPFTSEAKEALAHYPEIVNEIRLALQEIGRKLGNYLNKKKKLTKELSKVDYIEKYLSHVSSALQEILDFSNEEKFVLEEHLNIILNKSRNINKEEMEKIKQDYGPKLERKHIDLFDEAEENENIEKKDEEK